MVNNNTEDPHMKNSVSVSLAGYTVLDIWSLLIVCFLSLTLGLRRHVMTRPPCQKTTEAFKGPAIKVNTHGKIITEDFIYNCTKPCRILEAE